MIYKDEDGSFTPYAWPGGYPIFELMADGGTLCVSCANDKKNPVVCIDPGVAIHSIPISDQQWTVVASDINWEEDDLFCDHCNEKIESAYGDPHCEDKPPKGLKPKFLGRFVNVYLIDRAYGGPEEGGWWYDCGEAIESIQCLDADIHRVLTEKQIWCDEENSERRCDIGSVLSEGKYVVRIEELPAQGYPTTTPRYE